MAQALAAPRMAGVLRAAQVARRFAPVVLAIVVAAIALAAITHLAGAFSPARVFAALASLPAWRLAASLAFTIASYLLLTCYDLVALGSLGEKVPWRTAARAAFTSYALSHNLGFAPLTGGSARLRIYGAVGVPAVTVARVVLIAGVAFWGGVIAVAALSLAIGAPTFSLGSHTFHPGAARGAGVIILLTMIVLPLAARRVPGLRSALTQAIPVPHPGALALLLGLGALDLAFSALALFVLLPGLSLADFPQLYLVYALAIIAGLVTHVPGGLGVFEAVVLAALPGSAAHGAEIAAALVAYRAIYYLLPLAAALPLNAIAEAQGLRRRLQPMLTALNLVLFETAPGAMGALTFGGGLVLLLSGAFPAVHGRMHTLVRLLPLPFIEASHLAASLVGTALLLVAPALVARLESGMRAARLLFMLGAAFSLAKGLDFEEAAVMLALAGALQFAAPAFYRRSAGTFSAGSRGWLIAAAVAVTVSAASGFFAYRHVPYDSQLWWDFALHGDAPRFLRASFAAGILLAGYALGELLHRPHRGAGLARLPEGVFARATAGYGRSDAALAFTGDKRFLVHPEGDAFLMFSQRRRTWVIMGDPVGPSERWADLCWELRRQSDACYARLCFYQLSEAMLPLMVDLGLRPIKYGDEAHVAIDRFTLDGPRMKSLRNSHARARREDLILKFAKPDELPMWLPVLRGLSDSWLASRRHSEKNFSLGRFDPAYLGHFETAIVVRAGEPMRPLAFANIWRSGDGLELSVDLMRHAPEAPPATMDFLFLELIAHAKAIGCSRFNLGLAPLSGVQGGKLAPGWARLANLAFSVDAGAYGFAGLRRYKDKFAPEWQPRFIATSQGLAGLRALVDLVGLIANGPSRA